MSDTWEVVCTAAWRYCYTGESIKVLFEMRSSFFLSYFFLSIHSAFEICTFFVMTFQNKTQSHL
jgi:hypothetical protein